MHTSQATSSSAPQTWTVLSLIDWAARHLAGQRFDEARLHVELLLAHVLHLKRLDLYLQFDRPLTAVELADFKSLFKRRLTHEPLQYILGETEFMGLSLFVNSSVLIPRPETELLVEKAIERLAALPLPSPTIMDIGTGSGNIAIALAHFVPQARIIATDISPAALATAARNIERHAVQNVSLVEADVLGGMPSDNSFDMILSNPPYVSLVEYADLQPEVKDFEPRNASTDEADGLRYIRAITALAATRLKAKGSLLMEIGYGQADDASQIVSNACFSQVAIFPDVAGIPRVIIGSRP